MSLQCKNGCGTAIIAVKNGGRTEWQEVGTSTEHNCPNQPKAGDTKPCPTCGTAMSARVNGKAVIWVDGSNRKHTCTSATPTAISASQGGQTVATLPIAQGAENIARVNPADVYAALEELEREEAAAKQRELDQIKAKAEEAEQALRAAKASEYVVTVGEGSVPVLDKDCMVEETMLRATHRTIALADLGKPQNIGVHGPAGSGKTTFGLQIGALRGSPTFLCEAAGKQTADEWYTVTTGIVDGKIQTVPSHFVTGIETENAVVVINDINLLQDRTIQNGLNDFLDPSTRSTFVEQLGRRVTVAKGVIIVGTWNVGYSSGTELAEQIIDRFRAGILFEMPYPEDGALAHIIHVRSGLALPKAEELAEMASWFSGDSARIECSTRGLIAAACHVAQGATFGEAVAFTVFGELDSKQRQTAFGIIDKHRPGSPIWATPKRGNYVRIA